MFFRHVIRLLPVALFASLVQSQLPSCNGAAALQCCTAVVESTDPLALAALLLVGATPPLVPTQVGLACLPATAETGALW